MKRLAKMLRRPAAGLWLVLLALCAFTTVGHAAPGFAPTAPKADTPPASATKAKESKRPGGINPCMTPDPGFGIYDKWSRNITMGQMLAPQVGGITKSGKFDLIVHFHGHYPVRKEFVREAEGTVLVAIDLGIGSGAYSQAFASPDVFEKLVESVEKEMARRNGVKKASVRKLGLSSWSAGYGAIQQILAQDAGKGVDALILLDSVHAGYNDEHADKLSDRLKTDQLDPFVSFARRAKRGERFMFQSHSSIIPPGYASTREVSTYIVEKIGGKLKKSKRDDRYGLELFERYDHKGYHVRGYHGDDKPDHCAHLGLMKDIMKVHINRRWNSPKGRKGKAAIAKELKAAGTSGNIHTVKKGESLGSIARKHGVSVNDIRSANGLEKGGKPIQPGQQLIIPAASEKSSSDDGDSGPKPKQGEKVHTVAKGDALTVIAKKYGSTVKAIRQRNGLRRDGPPIRPGQKLIIPPKDSKGKSGKSSKKTSKSGSAKLKAGEKLHVVASGHSLGKIAKRYHVTVDAIRARNGMKKGHKPIQPGDKLIIPASK